MTEAMRKTDEFLDLYKTLEEKLKDKGYKNGRSSIVMQFISTPEGRRFKEDLNTCREMRNILVHNSDIGDEPPFVPSDSSINALRQIVDYLASPPLALSRAVAGDNLVCAKLSDKVKHVMDKMVKFGFSHIPVLDGGILYGVFSISTIFSCALKNSGVKINDNTQIKDFEHYLKVENHICEDFIFAPRTTTVFEAEKLLENNSGPSNKRPAAIFITHNGSHNEKILGMLTPWDVLGE